MISSMQKNKKWLLPTIWISTIAFVGAGFVGWGSYNPSTSSATVATVGSQEIPMNDLQKEYSNLYSQYQNAMGQQFNKEMAEQFKLESIAYNNLIQRYLMLNLGEDFGLTISNEEIFKELANIPSFVKDGQFDNIAYKSILKQNRTNPSEFEEQIRKNLIVQKVQDIYKSSTNDNTIDSLNTLLYAQDRVEINILSTNDINVSVNQKDIEDFYAKNKENYKSIEKFEVNVEKIAVGENEKESKKVALKKYLNLKKAKDTFKNKELLDINVDYLSIEEQKEIFSSEVGSVLKPIRVKDDFVVYQLIRKIAPTVLALEEISDKIRTDYISSVKNSKLSAKKDLLLNNFTGNDIGYIDKENLPVIEGLNANEVNSFVQKVFTATTLIDFIELENKIVVFKIIDTKLASFDKEKNTSIKDTILRLKNTEVISSIIEKLNTKYEIKSNYKVN